MCFALLFIQREVRDNHTLLPDQAIPFVIGIKITRGNQPLLQGASPTVISQAHCDRLEEVKYLRHEIVVSIDYLLRYFCRPDSACVRSSHKTGIVCNRVPENPKAIQRRNL